MDREAEVQFWKTPCNELYIHIYIHTYIHNIYIQRADPSLCYPLMWNVTLEYITNHFNVLGHIQIGNSSPTVQHIPANAQIDDAVIWWSSVRSSVESVPYPPRLESDAIRSSTGASSSIN